MGDDVCEVCRVLPVMGSTIQLISASMVYLTCKRP